jgi:Subtilisin inhibitor-like
MHARGVVQSVIGALALGTPLLTIAPAHAAAPAETSDPAGVFLLTISPERDPYALRATTLWCDPDGGGHPLAEPACGQIRDARGRIADIPEEHGACTKEYMPVRVSAYGSWNDALQHFSRTYPNPCTAIRGTGGVLFKF